MKVSLMGGFSSKLGRSSWWSSMKLSLLSGFSFDAQLAFWSSRFPCSEGFLKCGSTLILLLSRRLIFWIFSFHLFYLSCNLGLSTNFLISKNNIIMSSFTFHNFYMIVTFIVLSFHPLFFFWIDGSTPCSSLSHSFIMFRLLYLKIVCTFVFNWVFFHFCSVQSFYSLVIFILRSIHVVYNYV